MEFGWRNLPFARQAPVRVQYKGQDRSEGRVDFLIGDLLVVELKAVSELVPLHTAQVISYLKATRLRLGLLINFNTRTLKEGIRRIAL